MYFNYLYFNYFTTLMRQYTTPVPLCIGLLLCFIVDPGCARGIPANTCDMVIILKYRYSFTVYNNIWDWKLYVFYV